MARTIVDATPRRSPPMGSSPATVPSGPIPLRPGGTVGGRGSRPARTRCSTTMWRVVCSETGWRSRPYNYRDAAQTKARSIDAKVARVTGVSVHRHQVVAVDAGAPASTAER